MMTRMPAALQSSMELMTSLRGGSSMPTQPTKVKSVWSKARRFHVFLIHVRYLTFNAKLFTVSSVHHLVVGKLSGVLQVHLLFPQWRVSGGQSQAAECVAAGAPLLDDGHDVILDWASQGNTGGANTDVCAALNDAFWGTLMMHNSEFLFCQWHHLVLCFIYILMESIISYVFMLLSEVPSP